MKQALVLTTFLFAACAPGSAEQREQLAADDGLLSAAVLPTTGPTVTGLVLEGAGCPEGSYATNVSPDGRAGTITFDRSAETEGCTLRISFAQIPGLRVGPPVVFLRLDEALADAVPGLAIREGFASAPERRTVHTWPASGLLTLGPSEERVSLSPDCSQSEGTYVLTLEPTGIASAVGTILDFEWSHGRGVRIHDCAAEELRAPPGGPDEPCGGLFPLDCAEGLRCDENERCFDPLEPSPPAARFAGCGGLRQVPCEVGLVCNRAQGAGSERPGQCLRPFEERESACGGSAEVSCEGELVCWSRDGEAASAHSCQRPTSQEGEACGGVPARACAAALLCSGGVCQRTDGSAGAYCDEAYACADDLSCEVHRCADTSTWKVASEGERCGRPFRAKCAAALVCGSDYRCQ